MATAVPRGHFSRGESSAYLVSSHPYIVAEHSPDVWRRVELAILCGLYTYYRDRRPAFYQVYDVDAWHYFAEIDPAAGQLFDAAMTSLAIEATSSSLRLMISLHIIRWWTSAVGVAASVAARWPRCLLPIPGCMDSYLVVPQRLPE